jgi:hypothetical protein
LDSALLPRGLIWIGEPKFLGYGPYVLSQIFNHFFNVIGNVADYIGDVRGGVTAGFVFVGHRYTRNQSGI